MIALLAYIMTFTGSLFAAVNALDNLVGGGDERDGITIGIVGAAVGTAISLIA